MFQGGFKGALYIALQEAHQAALRVELIQWALKTIPGPLKGALDEEHQWRIQGSI